MYPFDSARGRLALGIAAASGGGWIITALMQFVKDPKHQQALQLLLVFWLIFVGKTTLAYMRLVAGKQPAAPQQRQQQQEQPADSSGTPEEKTRRRRTRRD